jgi:hypothetical protein
MYWLATTLMLAAQTPADNIEKIYVAPPTIHDPALQAYQPYVNSMLVSSANINTHWVARSKHADGALIYDKHTIGLALDTTCDYRKPLHCGSENYHWVMITDMFMSENFATIIVKLYDENSQLIASNSRSSYSVEECKPQIKQTNIKSQGLLGETKSEIVEKFPDKCVMLQPKILAKDINQAVTIMFASIHPAQ